MSAGIAVSERRLGDALEIAVYADGRFVAVITHPCAGAGWFLRSMVANKKRFKSRVTAETEATRLALKVIIDMEQQNIKARKRLPVIADKECPRCHGDGLTRINQTNNPNHSGEAECMLCSGHGIITVEE